MLWLLNFAHNFVNTAKEQVEVLQSMAKKMTSLYELISKYFTFDHKKYAMEEFFNDFKTFNRDFKVIVARLAFLADHVARR